MFWSSKRGILYYKYKNSIEFATLGLGWLAGSNLPLILVLLLSHAKHALNSIKKLGTQVHFFYEESSLVGFFRKLCEWVVKGLSVRYNIWVDHNLTDQKARMHLKAVAKSYRRLVLLSLYKKLLEDNASHKLLMNTITKKDQQRQSKSKPKLQD
jgi:hypothetical protein